jgi:23S rRNA pseudouridine2605 synthase
LSKQTTGLIRLNKFLADHGVASRRKADELIDEGRVQVNGRKVFELGIKIDPSKDRVKVGGKPIAVKPQPLYFVFNKPKSVVTSTSDPQDRPIVLDFFKKIKTRIFPVGRLDWDTEGLLLMTNDGDFSNEIASPESKIPKTYHVKLDGLITQEKMEKLRRGVSIIGGRVKAIHIKKLKKGTPKKDWVEITITEGKNRQVRKMF